MLTRKPSILTAFVVALPFLLKALWKIAPSIAAVPYLAYQIYYAPMALWLAEPFFGHDDELGIIVRYLGALVTAVAYGMIFIFIWTMFTRKRNREPV